MTRGAADMQGRIISREEAAIALGFVDVAAMDWWDAIRVKRDEIADRSARQVIDTLIHEVANLRSQIRMLEKRLADSGVERIG